MKGTIDGFDPGEPPVPPPKRKQGRPTLPTFTWTTPALAGLSADVMRSITRKVSPEMITALLGVLTTEWRYAKDVRRDLLHHQWWPKASVDTQLRFMRNIQATALSQKLPVVSGNDGLKIASARADLLEYAERERGGARGKLARAQLAEWVAQELFP